jgi:ABC-2 type transport system permease protein
MSAHGGDAQAGRGGFWRRLRALTRKEVRQLLRDRSNVAIGLVLPVLLIVLFGYGISLDVKDARVALVVDDHSPAVVRLLSGLRGSSYITPVPEPSMREAERALDERRADAILRVPADFSREFGAGQGRVQLVLHGADAATARTVQSYVAGALARGSLRLGGVQDLPAPDAGASAAGSGFGTVQVEPRLWFNAANTSTWYLVPGLMVLIMTLLGAFLTSLVVAREWERGTLEALFVTPARPTEILLAKMIPYFVVGMLGFAMCLAAARALFGVPLQGSFALLLLASVLYMFVALGVGLLISSVTKNQFVASQVALLTSFLPALMLSGFLFDLNNVPLIVRVVGQALPATHFLELVKTLMLAGNVWPIVIKDGAILVAYAVVLVGAARLATRKSIA